ncbi:DUF3987 domain-containing protein [Planctomycetota bacterium]
MGTQELREAILERIDYRTFYEKRLAGFRHSGGDQAKALCPFHDDGRASLSINIGDRSKQGAFRCFGCGAAGDVFAFVMKQDGIAFAKAVRRMADEVGVPPDVSRGKKRRRHAAKQSTRKVRKQTYATPGAAAEAIGERVGGKLVGEWIYQNADGSESFRVLRFDLPDGDKTYRPIHPMADGWIEGDPPGELPLYGQPFPTGPRRIYVPEGEKCVEALVVIGLIATTSAHGAGAADKTDWTPLAGWEVIILLDNDDAGRDYAESVAQILAKLDPPATVKIVMLPDLPEGGDVVDWMEALDGKEPAELREALEQLAEEAPVYELRGEEADAPVDVYRPFPVDALPEPARSYLVQGAEDIGCDPSYVALPMLSALAATIGNTRRIALKAGWQEPSVLWSAIVGESGVLKSPALERALKPLHDRQADAMRRYADAMAEYETDMLRYEMALKRWRNEGCEDGDDPPAKPSEPTPERYICSDTTVEALAMRLDQCPRGLLNARDELAGWIKSFDAYRKGHGGDAEQWLSMHGAKPLVIDRKTSGKPIIYVPRAAVSVTGSIQPEALRECLGRQYIENGLAARLLFAMPPVKPRRWSEAEVAPRVVSDVGNVFDQLLALEFDAANGEPVPVDLPLSPEAKALWARYVDEHGAETDALVGGDLAAAWRKLEGGAARLALVVHMVRVVVGDAEDGAVDAASITAGITLARWFAHEARRVYGLLHETDDERRERRLIQFILAKGGEVTARDLQRGGPCCKTAAEAEGLLDALADAGKGSWETREPGPKGGRPTNVFVLRCPTDTDATADLGPPGAA